MIAGFGNNEFDWLVVALSFIALLIQVYELPKALAKGPACGFPRIFSTAAWLAIFGRLTYVMFHSGDVIISIGIMTGIGLLALREIANSIHDHSGKTRHCADDC